MVQFILFLFIAVIPAKAEEISVFFTPSSACEDNIIAHIDDSQQKIDVAVYAINNDAIVESLIKAHQRGIAIRILTDRTQAGQKSSKVKVLEKAGIPLKRHRRHKIQHDKFAVFDEKKAVTGSFNWTNSASRKNAENCLFFLNSNATVDEYQERFNFLWQVN